MFHASCCCSLCLAAFIANTNRPGSRITLITTLIAALSPLTSLCLGGTAKSLPLNSLVLPLLTIPCYHLILQRMRRAFTFGEAAIACQGSLVLSFLAAEILLGRLQGERTIILPGIFVILVVFGALILALSAALLVNHRFGPSGLLGLILLVLSSLFLADLAVWVLFVFVPGKRQARILSLSYWMILTASTLPLMSRAAKWVKRSGKEGQLHHKGHLSLLRKGYHLLLLAIFLPVLFTDKDMICVSSSIAFAAMVFIETVRCSGFLPSKAKQALESFMGSFADEKDAGPIFTTHISLLLGAAVPIWISASPNHPIRPLEQILPLSGLVCLGVGDTAASMAGILLPWKKLKLFEDSSKTFQGALAGLVSMLLFWLYCGMGIRSSLHLILATFGASLLEASTHQIDNIVLPLAYTAHLLLLSQPKGRGD